MGDLERPWTAGRWFGVGADVFWVAACGHFAAAFAARHLIRDGLVTPRLLPTAVELLSAVVVVCLWEHIGVLLHELGHVVFAAWTGAGVKAVEIGQGTARLHWHIPGRAGRVCVTLRAYPGQGRTTKRRRVRPVASAWVSIGGPLADLAGLAVALVVVLPRLGGSEPLGLCRAAVTMIAVTQTGRFLRNALPRNTEGRFNDGGKVFLRAGRAQERTPGRTPFEEWEEKVRASNSGDPQPALVMTASLLDRLKPGTKQHQQMSSVLAVHLGRSGRFAEAVGHLEAALHEVTDVRQRQLLRAARADAILSDAVLAGADLPPADRESLRADLDPDESPEQRHSHALLLLSDGDAVAAAGEAMTALRSTASLAPVDRASVVATIVIALARSGDRAQARQWFAEIPAWSAWRPAAERSLVG